MKKTILFLALFCILMVTGCDFFGDMFSDEDENTLYSLTYDGNGGSLDQNEGLYSPGTNVSVDDGSSLSRPGYSFTWWNTEADGSGDIYGLNSTVNLSSDITLYAQWTREFEVFAGGIEEEWLYDLLETSDGSYVAVGHTESWNNSDIEDAYFIKCTASGDIIWENHIRRDELWERLNAVKEDSDGDYIAAGNRYYTAGSNTQAYLMKFDAGGTVLWEKEWGGLGDDQLNDCVVLDDGSILAVGSTTTSPEDDYTDTGWSDFLLLKFDNDGNLLMRKIWGSANSDALNTITLDTDGNIVTAGIIMGNYAGFTHRGSTDYYLAEMNSHGLVLWQDSWGGSGIEVVNDLVAAGDGTLALVGSTTSSDDDMTGLSVAGSADFYVAHYDSTGNRLGHSCWGGSSADTLYGAFVEGGTLYVAGDITSTDFPGLTILGTRDIYTAQVSLSTYSNSNDQNWGGSGQDMAYAMVAASGNGYVIAGASDSSMSGHTNMGYEDQYIRKFIP